MTSQFGSSGINPDISRAHSLPARNYTDPAIFNLEKSKIFSRAWQVVGHRHQLANPGDFFTIEILGEPLLLVRGTCGEIRGFYNVCRHRAGPPAEGCGSRKVFRCGYHGWTYGLDGKLISTPEFENVQGFDREHFSLRPVRAEEWLNLIFVNFDPEAESLRKSLAQLPQQAEKLNFESMKLFERRVYDMKCNWKTYVDNYLEGYHLPTVHPGLNRELDYNAYRVEPHERHVRQFSPIRARAGRGRYSTPLSRWAGRATTDYFWIFPNWMLNCYPDNVSLNIVLPSAVERSLAIFEWYLPEQNSNTQAGQDAVNFSHQVQIEDVSICEVVQKNLHSREVPPGSIQRHTREGGACLPSNV